MKYKWKYCEKLKLAIILFMTVLPIWKTNAQDFDNEDDNDNWKYFYDIAVESGIYSPVEKSFADNSFISTLSGSYFWSSKCGVRSGISLITGANSNEKYIKIPVLLSFRTKTFYGEFDAEHEYDDFGDALLNFILSLLPTRFEFNIGVSLGYITPETYSTTVAGTGSVHTETLNIHNPFAASIDANGRISFQFWRICVNGNLGINYLLTRNYKYGLYSLHEERYRPSWFLNASVGLAFRF